MFLRATGSAAALSLSGGLGLAQTLPEVGALHRLVEETPRERVAAELARLIRDGLDHRRTLTALAVATSRRVQPFPDVGFKYHTVLALQSVHLTALNLPDKERWLPVFWALDYFKRAQEAERRQSGWTMGPRPDPVAGTVEAARKSLIDALDRWDLGAVDPAILDFARFATPDQLSELLFRYGIRDLRAIGHKAIAVQNVHRLLPLVAPEYAPPVFRSLAAALQNHGHDPNRQRPPGGGGVGTDAVDRGDGHRGGRRHGEDLDGRGAAQQADGYMRSDACGRNAGGLRSRRCRR